MSTITRIEPGARMSNAVVHNGTVYLAGQVGEPGDGVAEQTRTILAEVDRLLALCGSDKTRILKAQIWLADIATFADIERSFQVGAQERVHVEICSHDGLIRQIRHLGNRFRSGRTPRKINPKVHHHWIR